MARAVPLDVGIAQKIGAIRSSRGIVKADMARHLGVTRQSYQLLEDGGTAFTVATLLSIAQKLGVKITDLIPED